MSYRNDNGLINYVARSYRSLPTDITIAVGVVLLADLAVLFLPASAEFLRVGFGLPLLFFCPGYALLTVLFPGKRATKRTSGVSGNRSTNDGVRRVRRRSIDAAERVAVSFGASLALLPFVVLLVSATFGTFSVLSVLVTINVVLGVLFAVGTARRLGTPENERFELPVRRIRESAFSRASVGTLVRNGVLVVSVLLVASSLVYTIAVPQAGQSSTELQLLTESGSGDLVASGYPTNLTAGEEEAMYVRVGNHENERVTYTLVVKLQRIDWQGDSSSVVQEQQLRQLDRSVPSGETWETQVEFTPEMTGEDLRLTYLLFKGDVPAEPDSNSAYRSVYTSINVTEEPEE